MTSREKKAQVVLNVDQTIRHRLDALRIVLRCSRARVGELALTGGGLITLEKQNYTSLKHVKALAERAHVTPERYTWLYSVAYKHMTYGPGLEELERDDSQVTGVLPAA